MDHASESPQHRHSDETAVSDDEAYEDTFPSSDNFKVVVRIRPPLEREMNGYHGFQNTVLIDRSRRAITLSENAEAIASGMPESSYMFATYRFTFDHVYDPGVTQEEVYATTALPVVKNALQGYNAAIVAYGQTGTGKTFTMEGEPDGPQRGIIPRAIHDIFQYIESDRQEGNRYLVRSSYLQIYNEVISDLLKPDRYNLVIREDRRRGIYIDGLSEWVVRTPAEVYSLMSRGAAQRATGATKLNDFSSRSHAVFIIIVEKSQTVVPPGGPEDEEVAAAMQGGMPVPVPLHSVKVGKLNLVDLAGSERVHITGATGQRLEESKKINQSLSALGNVISALTDHKPRQHIPYRDSKLTRILEDSLGGNCKTTMMCMASPALEAFSESLSTLKFANRAKNIKNEAHINEDVDQRTLLRKYERELKKLRTELQRRNRQLVDKRALLQIEEEKRRAEADKLAAITALEHRSQEFMDEKQQKKALERKIQEMQSQIMVGGEKLEEMPVFRTLLQREHRRIRGEYEERLNTLEQERHTVEEDKAQVDRYKQLLLKQRDIMIALTARLNERDEQILTLQEELEACDKYQHKLEDALDQRNGDLIALRKAALQHAALSPIKNTQLASALGEWGGFQSSDDLAELKAQMHAARANGIASAAAPGGESDESERSGTPPLGPSSANIFQARADAPGSGSGPSHPEREVAQLQAQLLDLQQQHQQFRQEALARIQSQAQQLSEGTAPGGRQEATGEAAELQGRLEALTLENARLQEAASSSQETHELKRQNELLRQEISTARAGSGQLAKLQQQCSHQSKERAALRTILDEKIRVLVRDISGSLAETNGIAAPHPRLGRQVAALDKLVAATVNALHVAAAGQS